MTIIYTPSPLTQDIDFLTAKINEETPDQGSAYPFAFFSRSDQGEIIAGCNGSVIFGAIYTDQLWVHPDHRHQGLGANLMERVHAYGRELGCTMATVSTMSFQNGQGFYERLGYVCDFERPGYEGGARCFFMKRGI